MNIPADFQFSQRCLQDYVDCPRRFQLRYLRKLAWPAVEAEPPQEHERHMRQGAAFHRMVHQHILGIPAEQIAPVITDDELGQWWNNYLDTPPPELPDTRYPELSLAARIAGRVLVARYDLVAIQPGKRAVIVDWKTAARKPARQTLQNRLQTRVYPYLLARTGARINDKQPLAADQITMVYWFAEAPEAIEIFQYDPSSQHKDESYLSRLIREIENRPADDFPLTGDEKKCRFCVYRSLCDRGIQAGPYQADDDPAAEDEVEFNIDFEQIAEIEF